MYHAVALQKPGMVEAQFNRRMRKTACPVVWEGAGNQSGPDPINFYDRFVIDLTDKGLISIHQTTIRNDYRLKTRGFFPDRDNQ